jgi:hypothetical protein
MYRRYDGMTLDQHKALGHDLKTATLAVVHALCHNAYALRSREIRALQKLGNALSHARCVLDDALGREQPQMPNAEFFAYYYSTNQTHPRQK